jgi:hypothetical protein
MGLPVTERGGPPGGGGIARPDALVGGRTGAEPGWVGTSVVAGAAATAEAGWAAGAAGTGVATCAGAAGADAATCAGGAGAGVAGAAGVAAGAGVAGAAGVAAGATWAGAAGATAGAGAGAAAGAGAGAGALAAGATGATAGGGVGTTGDGAGVTGAAATGATGAGRGAGGGAALGCSEAGRLVTRRAPVRLIGGGDTGSAPSPAAGLVPSAAGEPGSPVDATVLAGAFLAAAFLAGAAGSSGCTGRRRPSRSALRRARSACASSMDDEWLLTPIPRDRQRSRASLLVRPSS